jgi:hypothetical protein
MEFAKFSLGTSLERKNKRVLPKGSAYFFRFENLCPPES